MSPFVTVTIVYQCPQISKVTLFVVFCDLGLLRWVLDLEPDGGRPLFPTMQPSTKLMATPISPTDSDRRAAGGLRENRSRPSVIAAEQEQDAGRLDREQVQPAGEQAPQAILPTAAEPPHREAGRGVLDEDRLPRIGILPPHPSCGFFDKATGPPISATCATCTEILCIVNRRDRTESRHSLVIANVTHFDLLRSVRDGDAGDLHQQPLGQARHPDGGAGRQPVAAEVLAVDRVHRVVVAVQVGQVDVRHGDVVE